MQKARRHPKAPTVCRYTVSGTFSLPYAGCFSPFPHGTCTLSVIWEYLALADGAARFRQGFTGPALLRILLDPSLLLLQGFHLVSRRFPTNFEFDPLLTLQSYYPAKPVSFAVWAIPCSLATTNGITVVFSSYGYLDVSVPHVCLLADIPINRDGLPHSEIFGS